MVPPTEQVVKLQGVANYSVSLVALCCGCSRCYGMQSKQRDDAAQTRHTANTQANAMRIFSVVCVPLLS